MLSWAQALGGKPSGHSQLNTDHAAKTVRTRTLACPTAHPIQNRRIKDVSPPSIAGGMLFKNVNVVTQLQENTHAPLSSVKSKSPGWQPGRMNLSSIRRTAAAHTPPHPTCLTLTWKGPLLEMKGEISFCSPLRRPIKVAVFVMAIPIYQKLDGDPPNSTLVTKQDPGSFSFLKTELTGVRILPKRKAKKQTGATKGVLWSLF